MQGLKAQNIEKLCKEYSIKCNLISKKMTKILGNLLSFPSKQTLIKGNKV